MKSSNFRFTFRDSRTHYLIAFVCAASLSFSPVLLAQQTAPAVPPQDMTNTANAPAQEATPKIPNDQLDSLVAPIALYPDPLLAQILALVHMVEGLEVRSDEDVFIRSRSVGSPLYLPGLGINAS